MAVHRATLIQDIKEYLGLLRPYLDPLMESYSHLSGVTEEEVVLWIIKEEIELIYLLFDRKHSHRQVPHEDIHNNLEKMLPVSLSVLTSAYIKAPRLYVAHAEIEVDKKNGRDLYIRYYSDIPKTTF